MAAWSRPATPTSRVADAPLTDTTPVDNVVNVFTGGTGPMVLATFTDGNPYAQASDFNVDVKVKNSVGGKDDVKLIGNPTQTMQLVSQGTNDSTWELVVQNAIFVSTGVYSLSVTISDAGGNSVQTNNTTLDIKAAAIDQRLRPSPQ